MMKRALTLLIVVVLLMGFISPIAADDGDEYDGFFSFIRKYIAAWIAWFETQQAGEEKPDSVDATKPLK